MIYHVAITPSVKKMVFQSDRHMVFVFDLHVVFEGRRSLEL